MRRAESLPSTEEVGIPYDMISLESLGTFMLFGGIDGTTAFQACEFVIKANMLQQSNNPITFLINSPGGNVNDGFAIIDIMETSRLPVQTVGTGVIASMGLLILSAGEKGSRVLTHNTEIMAHQWMGGMEGKFHELMAMTNEHLRLKQMFIDHFLRHSTMTEKQINDILFSPSDRWLTPKECKKYGLVDRVTEYLDIPQGPVSRPKKASLKKSSSRGAVPQTEEP
ncbi:ATP-dependent Clp protease proteolytic subunit [Acinetobacter sp.]|uniref:ATP-dependent Clp protease proteolytic subunit n=1 Tax=Acinetobacter sp. TaxID=472 RepID=UPI0038903BAF